MKIVAGVTPLASAAEYTKGLNPEPGCRDACSAWLYWFAAKSNPPTIAFTAPLAGFIATIVAWISGICDSVQPSFSCLSQTTSPGVTTSVALVGGAPRLFASIWRLAHL